ILRFTVIKSLSYSESGIRDGYRFLFICGQPPVSAPHTVFFIQKPLSLPDERRLYEQTFRKSLFALQWVQRMDLSGN
ncbi:hypothetical protein, partial [Morganella morganii]|uniref:hypothetical protein n=1 Tax=Morganella morganii TaxID=582 RepID=UPI001BD36876